MSNPDELYQKILLQHHRQPKHERALDPCSCTESAYNPLCGDKITLFINERDNKIHEITFTAEGCAISRASASILTETLSGISLPEAEKKVLHILDALTSDAPVDLMDESQEDLKALLGVRKFSARIKCASLAWNACAKAVKSIR